jgi:hypothetical protein
MKMRNNFLIKVVTGPVPWPFSWGPFHRRRAFVLHGNDFQFKVWQRSTQEEGGRTHDPVELECHSGAENATTTCDFRGGSRLKRRTWVRQVPLD